MFVLPRLREFVRPQGVTLAPETPIRQAIDLLVAQKTSGVPVLDHGRRLIGYLTEKDCLRVLSTSAYGDAIETGTVRDYMSTVKLTLDPEMDLFSAIQAFLANNFPSLPVLEHGQLVGRVSRQDLLRGIQRVEQLIDQEKARAEADLRLQKPQTIQDLQRLVATQKTEQIVAALSQRHMDDPRPDAR